MIMSVVGACAMGFFMGRMIVKGELNQFLLGAMTILTPVIVFILAKIAGDTRKALVLVSINLSTMALTISLTIISRKVNQAYHTDPVFNAKVNAHVFRDPGRQLLIPQFNDQLAPCRSVFKPL